MKYPSWEYEVWMRLRAAKAAYEADAAAEDEARARILADQLAQGVP